MMAAIIKGLNNHCDVITCHKVQNAHSNSNIKCRSHSNIHCKNFLSP